MKSSTLLLVTTLLLALMLAAFVANTPTGNVVLDIDDTDFESFFEPEGGITAITGLDTFHTAAVCPGSIGVNTTLTADVEAVVEDENCITLAADSITLDCAGFRVVGVNGTGAGITVSGRTSVTVKNCDILNFENGILATSGLITSKFANNTIHNNSDWGTSFTISINGNLINDSQYFSNGWSCSGVAGCSGGGILIQLNSQNNSIANSNITDNTVYGILFNNAHHNTVGYNNITKNNWNGYGFGVSAVSSAIVNVIYNNTFDNHSVAVEALSSSHNQTIRNNTISNNTVAINLTGMGLSHVYGNRIRENRLAHANTDDASNEFDLNTSADIIGNFWQDIVNLSIVDSNGNEYGDTGAQYPYNLANSAFVLGSVQDDGPIIIPTPVINISISDSPDPVDAGSTLSFTVTLNVTGGTAYNTSVTFNYSSSVTFVSASPIPTGSASEEFLLGNLTIGVYTINITTTVAAGASGTLSSGANMTFYSENGTRTTGSVSITTAVTAAAPAPEPSGGGGGGGGSSCIDECVLGTGVCSPTGRLLCVKSGVCTKYIPTPCDTGEVCSSGACVPCPSSALCSAWGPCAYGLETRTCVTTPGCETPPLTRPCVILPVTELPSPIVPIVYGEMFAGTPIACAATATTESTISATPSAIDISGAVPFGYKLVSAPFNLNCDGNELDLTLSVPNSYTDFKVLKCTAGQCEENVIEKVEHLVNPCGSSTLTDEVKKELLGTTSVLLPEETTSFVTTERTITTGDSVESGNYGLSVDGTATVSLSGLTDAVPKPANPTLVILGMPLVVDVTDATTPLPATITLPVPISNGVEKESVAIYALDGTTWTYLGGTLHESGVISVLVDDINAFVSQGRAIFATAGNTCGPCDDTEFEPAYSYPGARTAVILVHGAFSDKSTFAPMLADFEATRQPFDAWTFAYPASKSLDQLSVSLADTLAAHSSQYDRVYLIGHSAGGLVIQKALWTAYTRGDDLTRVRKAILIGTPTGGSPAVQTLENAFNWLINRKTLAKVFNVHGQLIQASVTGIEVPEVPGIDYQVIAGTRSYPFNLDLFKDFDGSIPKNDGIITINSAQRVGTASVDNACKNYYELNLSHTDLIDNDLGIRVTERIVSSDLSEPGQALLGLNTYVQIPVLDCDPADQYMIVGKPLRPEERFDPTGCACGNGWCGEGETDASCPGDCGNVLTNEVLCTTSSVLLLVIIIGAASLGTTLIIMHHYRRKKTSPKWLYASEILILVTLAIILLLFGLCNERPWLWIAVLLILAAYFTLLILLERRHHHGEGTPVVSPTPMAPAPSAPIKPYAPQPAPRLNLADLELPNVKPVRRETILRLTPLKPDHHPEPEHQVPHEDIEAINNRLKNIQRRINLPTKEQGTHTQRPRGEHKQAHTRLDDVNAELEALKRKLNRLGRGNR